MPCPGFPKSHNSPCSPHWAGRIQSGGYFPYYSDPTGPGEKAACGRSSSTGPQMHSLILLDRRPRHQQRKHLLPAQFHCRHILTSSLSVPFRSGSIRSVNSYLSLTMSRWIVLVDTSNFAKASPGLVPCPCSNTHGFPASSAMPCRYSHHYPYYA